MPLLGGSQREARETAQRLSRPVAHRESGFPCLGSRGCTPGNSRRSASAVNSRPWQLASLVLIEPPAHVRGGVPPLSIRGGCTPGNSRLWQLASLVLIEPPAHVRGPVPPLSIRGGCTPGNSRPWQLAIARAHRTANARARRGLCAVLSPPLGRGPSAAQKRKLGKQRPQARLFQQGAASQAAGRVRPFFQKSCKKPFTFGTPAQYTGG